MASRARARLLEAPEARPVTDEAIGHVARPLPPDCPVKPLGMLEGDTPTAVFLSGSGTIAKLSGQSMGLGNLEGLFAPRNSYLWRHWPRTSKKGTVDGFRAELVRADLFHAAGARGIWSDLERVRGTGAWRASGGDLALHLGDRVLLRGQAHPWGELDGYVYPAGPSAPGPAEDAQLDGRAAEEVLALLRTWRWKHPDVAPRLVLGWLCAALIGGALHWRPAIWPTGDKGTGKSSLVAALQMLLGPNWSVTTANTTAAGIRQALVNSSVPVLLDELESRADKQETVASVIELLRQASSGTIGLRGGSDHKGKSFQIRSAMMASSINVPPLRAQDVSRITVLELLELERGASVPVMTAARLQPLGQRLLRRMLDLWPHLPDRLAVWQAELSAHAGLDARGCDQYGTLLACADLALHDQPPDGESLDEVVGSRSDVQMRGLRALLGSVRSDDVADWRRCLDHLLTYTADVYKGGERMTLGRLVYRAAGREHDDGIDEAQRCLAVYGVRVLHEQATQWLAVANQHQGLSRVYERTLWAGQSGTSGGWRQALLRVPGGMPRASGLRFDGPQTRVIMLPLHTVLADD